MDLRLVEPLLVGLGARKTVLEFRIIDDSALLEVDEQHLPRLEPPFLDDLLLGDVQHAHL